MSAQPSKVTSHFTSRHDNILIAKGVFVLLCLSDKVCLCFIIVIFFPVSFFCNELETMGKKSKKGVSRAGRTARPGQGQGKSRNVSRSLSVGSAASRDELCGLSIDSSEPRVVGKSKTSAPPLAVNVVSPIKEMAPSAVLLSPEGSSDEENKQNAKQVVETAKQVVKKVVPEPAMKEVASSVTEIAKQVPKVDTAAPAVVETPKGENLWTNNLRDVVSEEEKEEPAVLDITMDEGAPPEVHGVAARALPIEDEPKHQTKVQEQSRGIVSLDEPASKEASQKTDDCGCIIL